MTLSFKSRFEMPSVIFTDIPLVQYTFLIESNQVKIIWHWIYFSNSILELFCFPIEWEVIGSINTTDW